MSNLKEFSKKFYYNCERVDNKKINTLKSIKKDIDQFLNYLEEENILKLEEITSMEIKSFLLNMSSQEYSKSTINRKLSSIKLFFKYLKEKSIIKIDPSLLVETYSFDKTEKNIPEIINIDELNKIRDVIDITKFSGIRDRLIVELLYSTGMSPSELLYLAEINFNISEREITLASASDKRKIFFSERTVFFYKEYLKIKEEKFGSNYNKNILFVNNSETRLSDRSLRRIIEKYSVKAEINKNVSPYTFRHSFIVYMLRKGMKKESIAYLLSLKTIELLDIYEEVVKKEKLWVKNV